MNKTAQEQCAEEIVDLFVRTNEDFDSYTPPKEALESILNKHFPQPPAATPSLDEVVEKWALEWHCGKVATLDKLIKQAILEYNASLVAEVERLKDLLEIESIKETCVVCKHSMSPSLIESGWCLECICKDAIQERDQLRAQLATAEQTGYERGVREAAAIAHLGTCDGYPDCGSPICERNEEIHQTILNLLNKKGTE